MPSVSGETLVLPPSCISQALAAMAGAAAFCASSPPTGWNSAPTADGVLLERLAGLDVVVPDLRDRRDDLGRHALRNEDAEVVGRDLQVRQRLGDRLDRAEALELERLVADGRERAQPLGADVVGLFHRQLRRHVGLAGHRGDHGRVATVVRYVAVGHARRLGDELDRVEARRRHAAGGHLDLARLALHRLEQLGHRLVRTRRVGADDGHVRDAEEEVPVLGRHVQHAERLVDAQVLRRPGGPGVAVVRRIPDALGADRARRARLVHDHDLLAEHLLEFGGGDARHLVGRAAGGPRHDQVDRLGRLPLLGVGGEGQGQARGEGEAGPDEVALVHDCLLLCMGSCGSN